MSKLILCSGKRSKVPYHFPLTETNIYSIEELCVYIYTNVYMMNEELFTQTLANYMEHELELKDRADKLRELLRTRASLKDLIVCVLCSCDYYTEHEIKVIIKIVDEICDLSQLKRNILLADQYLKYNNFAKAKAMYQTILEDEQAQTLGEKELGNLLHNMGMIQLHLTGFLDAAHLFLMAYEHNHNMESLHQYLLALKVSVNEESYQRELSHFTNGVAMDRIIKEELAVVEEKMIKTNDNKTVGAIKEWKNEGKMALYYREVDGLLTKWKKSYRQQNSIQEG